MPSSRGSSQPRDQTHVSCVSCTAGRFLLLSHRERPSLFACVCMYVCIVCECVYIFMYTFLYATSSFSMQLIMGIFLASVSQST